MLMDTADSSGADYVMCSQYMQFDELVMSYVSLTAALIVCVH